MKLWRKDQDDWPETREHADIHAEISMAVECLGQLISRRLPNNRDKELAEAELKAVYVYAHMALEPGSAPPKHKEQIDG